MESSLSEAKYEPANAPQKKESFLDDVIRFLRRLLGYCLCVVTCGCVPPPNGRMNGADYETALSDSEREAVNNLLKYLDSKAALNPTIDEERLRALCILTYSDNIELQRSAALCFAEISDRMMVPLSLTTMEPLNVLLQSRDTEVLRAASLAISNFALEGSKENKAIIASSGSIPLLVSLLSSTNLEVQCNVCGCITTLATDDENKVDIVQVGASKPLLALCKSPDLRVQRNAVGAVLNLTHLLENRDELVINGAIPILVEVQTSKDVDVQYYSTAALSNLGISERHRTMMVAVGHCDVIRQLISLAQSPAEKVRCQACLALRNLACDTDNQLIIVRYDGLPALKHVLVRSSGETLAAVTACIRNLSVHKANEVAIICESFLPELQMILTDSGNPEAQKHAAGTIRNLSAGDHARVIVNTGNVETLCSLVLKSQTRATGAMLSVMIEATAALAILADEDEVKHMMLEYEGGQVITKLIDLAHRSSNSELRYNCAGTLGQIAVIEIPPVLVQSSMTNLLSYLADFLHSDDSSFVHIALWTLVHLLNNPEFLKVVQRSKLPKSITQLQKSQESPAVHELAETVIDKLIGKDEPDSG